MKIYIAYKKRTGAWGGGNQFLTSMELEFDKQKKITKKISNADIALINSFTDIGLIIKVLLKVNKIPIIHRIDGPISKYRSDKFSGMLDDLIVIFISNFIADATIFQSIYSLNYFLNNSFFNKKNKYKVIKNTAKNIFFNSSNINFKRNQKLKIICTSWSNNKNKGSEYLIKLDKELDFSLFEFSFIGNIDCDFKNIKKLGVIPNEEIPNYLNQNHVFFSASIFECCSNSLCEALAAGLPCVVHNSGGNKELIKNGGITFNNFAESVKALKLMKKDYFKYKSKIEINKPIHVSKIYYNYFQKISANFKFNSFIKVKRIFAVFVILIYLSFKKSYVFLKNFFY